MRRQRRVQRAGVDIFQQEDVPVSQNAMCRQYSRLAVIDGRDVDTYPVDLPVINEPLSRIWVQA